MPDPAEQALENIQTSARGYNRGRRRGDTANVDPEFVAAMEITDPEQRRAALAQYARQRASSMFAPPGTPTGATPMPQGADVVRQAFPEGDAFASVADSASQVRQADVVPPAPPSRADMAEDKMQQSDTEMAALLGLYADPNAMARYQAPIDDVEDSPRAFQIRQARGRKELAPFQSEIDADMADEAAEARDTARIERRPDEATMQSMDDRMYQDIARDAPDALSQYQNIPNIGAEDSPEQFNARQVAGKGILARRRRR
jgi:hypothetical protein